MKTQYKKVYLATTLRQPINHTKSYWSFAKAATSTGLHKSTIGTNFSAWIRSFSDLPSYFVRYFNHKKPINPNSRDNYSKSSTSLEMAVETIEKFDFVIDTKFLERDMNKMFDQIGVKVKFDEHQNASEKEPISMVDDQYIRDIRKDDFKLLNHFGISIG